MLMRQKDFPRELLIGDSVWRVRFVRIVPETAGKGRVVVGLACPETQTIFVKTGLKPVDRFAVFLHELVHACEDEYGFEIPHDMLNRMDMALARALIDNFGGRARRQKPAQSATLAS